MIAGGRGVRLPTTLVLVACYLGAIAACTSATSSGGSGEDGGADTSDAMTDGGQPDESTSDVVIGDQGASDASGDISQPIDAASDVVGEDHAPSDASGDNSQPDGAPSDALSDAPPGTDAAGDAGGVGDAGDAGPSTCNGAVLQGSFTVTNAIDVQTLAGYCGLTGDLTIIAPGLSDVTLATIVFIGGTLQLSSNLSSLNLPVLSSAGNLDLNDTSITLGSFSIPALTTVAGSMNISIPTLTSVSAPALTSVGDVSVGPLPNLTSIDFPVLATGGVGVTGLPIAATFPSLTSDGDGGLLVDTNSAVSFPALVTAGGLEVDYGAATTVAIPQLVTGGRILLVGGASNATASFSAPSMTSAAVDVELTAGEISLDLHALQTATIWIWKTTVASLDLSSLTTLVTPAGSAACTNATMQWPPLFGCSFLYSQNHSTVTPQFPKLTSAESIWIDGDTGITQPIAFPVLTSIGSLLQVNTVPAMSAPAMTSVNGEVSLGDNVSIDAGISTGPDPALQSVDISALQSAATLYVNASVSAPTAKLTNANLIELSYVTAVDFSSLQSGAIQLSSTTQSGPLTFPALTTSGGVSVAYSAFTSLSAPVLTTSGNIFVSQDSLTSISFPALTAGDELAIEYQANLTSISFPMLSRLGATNSSGLYFYYDPALPLCQADKLDAQLAADGFTGPFVTMGLGSGTCP